MAQLKFPGDQTPFNQLLREDVDIAPRSSSGSMKASQIVATFGADVVGYLRTWSAEGFPHEGKDKLHVVDSTAPDTLLEWKAIGASSPKSPQGPLCVHYLPFSPSTHLW